MNITWMGEFKICDSYTSRLKKRVEGHGVTVHAEFVHPMAPTKAECGLPLKAMHFYLAD